MSMAGRRSPAIAGVAFLLATTANAATLFGAGSAGASAVFDLNDQAMPVIGIQFQEDKVCTTACTFEYWARPLDNHQQEGTVIGISGHDGNTLSTFSERPNYIMAFANAGQLDCWFKEQMFSCKAEENPYSALVPNEWHHYACSYDGATGNVAIYVDGVEACSWTDQANVKLGSGETMSTYLAGHLGQEADAFDGNFQHNQQFVGAVDEVRIWKSARTAAEIKDNMHKTAITGGTNLIVHLNFDDLASYPTITDESGSGNNGMNGRLVAAAQFMTFSDRDPGRPTATRITTSKAPVTGGETYVAARATGKTSITLHAYLVDAGAVDGDITVTLSALSLSSGGILEATDGGGALSVGNTITGFAAVSCASLTRALCFDDMTCKWNATATTPACEADATKPAKTHLTKTVFLTAATTFTRDTFSYTVSDGSSSVVAVVVIEKEAAWAPDLTYIIEEDTSVIVNLPIQHQNGDSYSVKVDTLPAKGTLYQAGFTAELNSNGYVGYLAREKVAANLTAVAAGDAVSDVSNALFYYPADNEFLNSETTCYAEFTYTVTAGAATGSGKVCIRVKPVNDAPVGVAQTLAAGAHDIQLTSNDVDDNFAPKVFYRISKFPKIGRLEHLEPKTGGGFTSLGDLAYGKYPPTIASWTAEIVDWSSQYSRNGCYYSIPCLDADPPAYLVSDQFGDVAMAAGKGGCKKEQTLPYDECFDAAENPARDWNWYNLIGAPLRYPAYGDSPLAPQFLLDRGPEFLIIRFDTPKNVFTVNEIEIYETYIPGAIIGVYVTENYISASESTWVTLWEGEPTIEKGMSRIFAPPLCPVAVQMDALMLRANTAAVPGWNSYDAIKGIGYYETPYDRLKSSADWIRYTPLDGVYLADGGTDSVGFRASDCENEGEEALVTIAAPERPSDWKTSAVFGKFLYEVTPEVKSWGTAAIMAQMIEVIAEKTTGITTEGIEYESGMFEYYGLMEDAKATMNDPEASTPLTYGADEIKKTLLTGLSTLRLAFLHPDGYIFDFELVFKGVDTMSEASKSTIIALYCLFMVCWVVLFGIFVYGRNKPLMRAYSIVLMNMIGLGLLIWGTAIPAAFMLEKVDVESANTACALQVALPTVGIAAFMLPLLLKVWRAVSVFEGASKLRTVIITNATLIKGEVIGLILIIAINAANWVEVEEMGARFMDQGESDLGYYVCPDTVTSNVMVGIFGIMTFTLAMVAFMGRNIPSDFNEIVHLLYMSLFFLLFGGIIMVVAGNPNRHPDSDLFVALGHMVGCFFGLLATFGEKCYLVLSGQADRQANTTMSKKSFASSAAKSSVTNSKHVSSADSSGR